MAENNSRWSIWLFDERNIRISSNSCAMKNFSISWRSDIDRKQKVVFDFSSRLLKRTMNLSEFLIYVKSQLVGIKALI